MAPRETYQDPTYPDGREQNLPKYAQVTLARLRQRLTEAEQRFSELRELSPVTNIWYGDYGTPIYVPNIRDTTTVHFDLDGSHQNGEHNFRFDIQVRHSRDHHRDGWLEISGGETLVIEAQSSNRICLTAAPLAYSDVPRFLGNDNHAANNRTT